MQDLLDRLQRCLEEQLPGMAGSLNPGASDADLRALEQHIGHDLPAPWHALYRWHDGQSMDIDGALGLFVGLPFLPIKRVIALWDFEARPASPPSPEEVAEWAQSYSCLPPGTVKQRAFSPAWIPLADDDGGNYLGLDLDPDTLGAPGQVITFGGREFVRVQAAPSLPAFLEDLLRLYEQHEYELSEDEDDEDGGDAVITTTSPYAEHFSDYLLERARAAQASRGAPI